MNFPVSLHTGFRKIVHVLHTFATWIIHTTPHAIFMHTNRQSGESSRETEIPGRLTPQKEKRSVEKEGVTEKRTQKMRRGWGGAPLGALVRKHRGGIGVNQETLSQLRAGPTLSSAQPGKSFSSDSAHKQRNPFLPCDGRWIDCIMLSQELLFQVCLEVGVGEEGKWKTNYLQPAVSIL